MSKITIEASGRMPILGNMLIALLLVASPVRGMVYMWKDSAGIAHYSNKEYDVPDRYKAKARALYSDPSDSVKAQPANTTVQAPPAAQAPAVVKQPEGQPEVRPDAAPAQVISIPSKTTERRARKRERRQDDE